MAKKQKRQFYIYLGIASLLLLCLFKMPYGFYTLVRFLAMAAFAYLAYLEYKSKNMDRMVVFIVLAVLFQPFAKIALRKVGLEHSGCGSSHLSPVPFVQDSQEIKPQG